jgi:hypothetical protein
MTLRAIWNSVSGREPIQRNAPPAAACPRPENTTMPHTTTDSAVDVPDRWPQVPTTSDVVRVSAPELVPIVRRAVGPWVVLLVLAVAGATWVLVDRIDRLAALLSLR